MNGTWKKLLRSFEWGWALGGILAVSLLFMGSLWWSGQWRLPGFPPLASLRAKVSHSQPLFLDRFGRVLQEMDGEQSAHRVSWLPLSAISPELLEQVVNVQDKRFYKHYGVDLRGFAGAIRDALLGHQRSASTISMQTADLLLGKAKEGDHGLVSSFGSIFYALILDAQWTKAEILEAYLNLIPFADGLVGVDAASRTLFQKEPQALEAKEAVLLTALLVDDRDEEMSRLQARACRILRLRGLEDQVETKRGEGCPELKGFVARTLAQRRVGGAVVNHAPEVAALLLQRLQGMNPAAGMDLGFAAPIEDSARLVAGSATLRAQSQMLSQVQEEEPKREQASPILNKNSSPRALYAQALKPDAHSWKTTLDRDLQSLANDELERLDGRSPAAILILDNRTGEVLAYASTQAEVAARSFLRANEAPKQPVVGQAAAAQEAGAALPRPSTVEGAARFHSTFAGADPIQSPRSPGALLDPFLFAAAFEQRVLNPRSLLEVLPAPQPLAGGAQSPAQGESLVHGMVTARQALIESLRVPRERTLALVGTDRWRQRLRSLGLKASDFPTEQKASLWQLTNAYRILANQGIVSEPRFLLDEFEDRLIFGSASMGVGAAPEQIVFSPGVTFQVADALADRQAPGMAPKLSFWTAAKLGRSDDGFDFWSIGFSSRYTVGVWLGRSEPRGGEAQSAAALLPSSDEPGRTELDNVGRIWQRIMENLHQDFVHGTVKRPQPSGGVLNAFTKPLTVEDKISLGAAALNRGAPMQPVAPTAPVVAPAPAKNPARPAAPALATAKASAPHPTGTKSGRVVEIVSPMRGSRINVSTVVQLKAQGSALGEVTWLLNGESLGPAQKAQERKLMPGRHWLALKDRYGRILDEVRFEVR